MWQTVAETAPGLYQGIDFALSPKQGYFVYVQSGGQWPGL
jgi:hypothetical protein